MGSVPFDMAAERERSRGRYPTPPESVTKERLQRVRASMDDHDLDGVVVFGDGSHPDNILHLAGFIHVFHYAYSLLVVPAEEPPVLLSDQDWHLDEAKKMSWIDDVRAMPLRRGSFERLTRTLETALEDASLSTGRIGTQNSYLPAKCLEALRAAAPTAEWVDGSQVWTDYVTSPSEYDIEMIHRTGGIADEAQAAAKATAGAGRTEREVCLAAIERMATMGADFLHGCANDTHINIGSHSHVISNVRPYLFTNTRLEHGQMFWVDLTAQYRGYHIDCDRTISIGTPSTEQREIYDTTRRMYDAMEDALEPGLPAGELWDIGMEIAEEAGYGDYVNFVYFGHSSGIETSEAPFGIAGDTREIRDGSFYNLEPGIFVPDVGSACIENTIHVTEDGNERVNQFDIDLHVV